MEQQFSRNIPALNKEEQELLAQKHVLVAGCGGLGGYAVELLARLGVGKLTVADCDDFEESNLNRQVLATRAELGKAKAFAAQARAKAIHPTLAVRPWNARIGAATVDMALQGVDLVIDALDNAEDRLLLEAACSRANVPMVHGAIVGWRLQVMVVLPGSGSLRTLYQNNARSMSKSTLAMTPALCASIQVGEAVKLLRGRRSDLEGRVFSMDLEDFSQQISAPDAQVFAPKTIRIVLQQGSVKNELETAENTTVAQVLAQIPHRVEGTYVLCNSKVITPEDAETTCVENGDVITIHKGVGVGG